MLAVIRKIISIEPMQGYDTIELATVGGWNVVVKKGEFAVGDFALYFSINSILPINDATKFLCDSKTGKIMRLKSRRFRSYLSQGLAAPLSWLKAFSVDIPTVIEEGLDLTEQLGVTKFIPVEEAAEYSNSDRASWPQYIPKTDEPRVQNVVGKLLSLTGREIVITQKYDGTSTTFCLYQNRFFVCSRNYELVTIQSPYHDMAEKYSIENKLRSLGRNLAIQGETVGPKINGNRHGLTEIAFYVFNIYDIDASQYLPWPEVVQICNVFEINTVPEIYRGEWDIDDHSCFGLLQMADGERYDTGKPCEGIVLKTIDVKPRFSCKAISNRYIEKYSL